MQIFLVAVWTLKRTSEFWGEKRLRTDRHWMVYVPLLEKPVRWEFLRETMGISLAALTDLEKSQQQTSLEDPDRGARGALTERCHVPPAAEHAPSWLLSLMPQTHQAQLPEAVSFPFHGLMHQLEVDLLTSWPVIQSVSHRRVKGAPQNPAPHFGHIPQWQESSFPLQRDTMGWEQLLQKSRPCGTGESLGMQWLHCTEQLLRTLEVIQICRRLWS